MEQMKIGMSAALCYRNGIQKALYLCTGFCIAALYLLIANNEWQWFIGYGAGTLYLFALFTSAESRYKTVGVLGRKIAFRVETERAIYQETTWKLPEDIITAARTEGVMSFLIVFFCCSAVAWILYGVSRYFF